MALYPSRYSILPEDYEFDGLLSPYVEPPVYAAPEPVYPFTNPWQDMGYTPDQGLLAPTATPTATPTAYPDAGQQVPQVQTAAPQVQAAPVRQGNWSPFQGSVDDGTSYVPYGGVNWAGLPGYESFIKPASGGGDNYEEAGINTQAFRDYLAQTGYTFQEDSLGRDDSGDSAFTRYAIDRDGNTVEASRINGSYESSQNLFSRAAKLAAVMGTAYLGGTALAGMGGTGAGVLTGVDAAMADLAASGGLTASSMAPAAAGSALGSTALTGVDAAMADLAASGGLTPASMASAAAPVATEGLLSQAVAPEVAATVAPEQIVVTGSRAAPSLLPAVLPTAALATAALTTPSTPTPEPPAPNPQTPQEEARFREANDGPMAPANPPGPLDQLKLWAQANPTLAKMMFSGATSLLSTSGGGGDSKGGYVDSGYRPTISRGGFQARVPTAPTNGPTGLLNPSMKPVTLPSTGQANDGLWRYGLLGPGRG